MRRQGIIAVVFAALLVLSVVVFFLVIKPMTRVEETPEEKPETEAGEVLGTQNRFFMFGSLERKDIKTITVDNEYGGFTFENNGKGEFRIKGFDSVNYNQELFASLVSLSTYTLAKTKVASGLDKDGLSEYGLAKPVASWTVKTGSGDSYTVYVGDKLLTGGGYYCRLEGRNSVYVLGTEVGDAVLVPIENYVTPILSAGISKDDYYMTEDFTFYSHGEKLFSLRHVDKEDMINPNALAEVIMDYPTEYYPNSSLYYQIIYSFMELYGDGCVKLGAGKKDLEKAGLADPAYRITYVYGGKEYEISFSEKKEEDGVYYAVSSMYPNVIAYCLAENFEYLEYGLIDWIEEYVFQEYVTNIATMSVKSDKVSAEFELFHDFDKEGNALLSIVSDEKRLTETQVGNFRQYYKSFLAIAIQDYYTKDEYCKMTEKEMEKFISDKKNAYLTFEYKTLDGKETEIAFYRYSTRHSVVTINGVGEFYVLSDLVQKIENDTVRILKGETVTAFGKN